MRLHWPDTRDGDFSLHNIRCVHILEAISIWTDLLRSHQTLLRNWVVIKVAFWFVKKHAVRHGQSTWNLPLYLREISLGPSSNSDQKCMAMPGLRVNQGSESRYQEREISLELDQISWGKGNGMYMMLWWSVWYDLQVHIGVYTSY